MNQHEKSNPAVSNALDDIASLARLLAEKGWAQGPGGNISYNLGPITADPLTPTAAPVKLGRSFTALAENLIVITATGRTMRDIAANPSDNVCIIRLTPDPDAYELLSPSSGARPTSELPSHLAIHQLYTQKGLKSTAVVHTHPNELTALTHCPQLQNTESLTSLLSSMHTEVIMDIPHGIAFVPYEMPASQAVADATLSALTQTPVCVWEKHGALAVAPTPHKSFDLIDIANKAATIYLLCKNAGIEPQGLTEAQVRQIKDKGWL
ncbi:Rhamnulose-1-phosphate aldolase [Anaerohalosphaera lusitana]|uniref:Rhamnulose-1-phosphate aldolase n=1 Tax=Anaerohalosphaera lusitana TaxID=1936003 RepID=A0A1U9NHU7_9BACT|nr:rhamnulose-1-phosphate aldolase [Anaerohalosphaera lusitana]AQT67086.1 Rhamnulose-1-phosphate aldolase [Anaerohalosphaera lusitana]